MSNLAPHLPISTDADDPQTQAIFAAIRQLVSALGPIERAQLVRELSPNPPRSGGVLATVLKLIPKDQRFSADEILRGVDAAGVEASRKDVHNALGYLRKKGHIHRVGHGKYMIGGALYETAEDLGVGPPTRHEIDDT